MSLFKTYRNLQWQQWATLFICWTLVALFISTQLYFNGIKNGTQTTWWIVFRDQLPIWWLWALLSPILLYISTLKVLSDNALWKSIGVYFASALPFLLLTSNLSLVYLFLTHGYIDLGNTNFQEYSPYLYSRLANDALIYIFTVGILLFVQSYQQRKQHALELVQMQLRNDQLNSQLTKAQLQALKLQLNPHFLFNTLHTISSLTLIGEGKISAGITTRLGDFLRRTLDYEEEQLVTLKKELEFFDLYLDIESIRFKDRLKVVRQVPEEFLGVKVPNLILQPLVENAIKHGISRQKSAGIISLHVEKKDSLLLLILHNEGPLLTEKQNLGIGLKNVHERLARIYGSTASLEIQNDEAGKGVNSILTLPIKAPALDSL